MEFHALRVDLHSPDLVITADGAYSDGGFSSVKVSSFVRDNGLLAGINTLPFDPVSGREGEPRTNIGVVISGGLELSPPHAGFDALVMYKNGGAAIAAQSEMAETTTETIQTAVGGFMRVLENSEPVPRVIGLKDRHPRTAAGISADSRFLYLLVIDGRRLGSFGATEYETALVLRSLGSHNGINFDGGGSTALALRFPNGEVRVINTPIHNAIPGRERAVAACFGIGVR